MNFCRELMQGFDKTDRRFMLWGLAFLFILITVSYSLTNIFYYPVSIYGDVGEYNALLNSDTCAFIVGDEFVIINAQQNDVRNILFGVVNMPFGLMARLLSNLFFFVPHAYPYFLALVMGALLLAGIVMLGKIIEKKGLPKLPFMLAMLFSFPTLFNLLNIEQYSLSVFWIMILLYSYIFRRTDRLLCYIGATGSICTTGILLPLILEPGEKKIAGTVRVLLHAMLTAACVFVVFGFLSYFAHSLLNEISNWVGSNSVSLGARLLQFFNAVSSFFVMPRMRIVSYYICDIAYDTAPVQSLNIAGCALFAMAVLGFVLDRKDSYARICASWVLLSVFVMVIVGWGAPQSCMPLYGPYFSWAYISLVYIELNALLSRLPDKTRSVIQYALAIGLFAINIYKMSDIFSFALTYYPA